MADPCPYCVQRARMEAEYNSIIGPCPLHAIEDDSGAMGHSAHGNPYREAVTA